jgi:hypothetical protein
VRSVVGRSVVTATVPSFWGAIAGRVACWERLVGRFVDFVPLPWRRPHQVRAYRPKASAANASNSRRLTVNSSSGCSLRRGTFDGLRIALDQPRSCAMARVSERDDGDDAPRFRLNNDHLIVEHDIFVAAILLHDVD